MKNKLAHIIGIVIGLIVVALSLWLWDKIIAWAFNGGINISTVFNLNSGFIVLCLMALIGIATLLYLVVRLILWRINL
jgi:hypothetical protein